MAPAKLVVLFTFCLALIFSHIRADVSIDGGVESDKPVGVTVVDGSDSSAHKIELDQLKSKLQTLGQFSLEGCKVVCFVLFFPLWIIVLQFGCC